MKRIALFLALLFPVLANASEGWTQLAATDTSVWEFQNGSLKLMPDQTQELFWTVMFRVHDPKEKDPSYIFWRLAVSVQNCEQHEGEILFISMNRKTEAKKPFVFRGNTVGSTIAEAICSAGDSVKKKYDEQQEAEKTKVST